MQKKLIKMMPSEIANEIKLWIKIYCYNEQLVNSNQILNGLLGVQRSEEEIKIFKQRLWLAMQELKKKGILVPHKRGKEKSHWWKVILKKEQKMSTDLKLKLSEHFVAKEFQCHDGSALPDSFPKTIKDTVEFLEALRVKIQKRLPTSEKNRGLKILSGYRSPAYNARLKGVKVVSKGNQSRHTMGQAADVVPACGYKHFKYIDFYNMVIDIAGEFKKRMNRAYRIGKYPSSKFVHIDCAYGYGGLRWTGK